MELKLELLGGSKFKMHSAFLSAEVDEINNCFDTDVYFKISQAQLLFIDLVLYIQEQFQEKPQKYQKTAVELDKLPPHYYNIAASDDVEVMQKIALTTLNKL